MDTLIESHAIVAVLKQIICLSTVIGSFILGSKLLSSPAPEGQIDFQWGQLKLNFRASVGVLVIFFGIVVAGISVWRGSEVYHKEFSGSPVPVQGDQGREFRSIQALPPEASAQNSQNREYRSTQALPPKASVTR